MRRRHLLAMLMSLPCALPTWGAQGTSPSPRTLPFQMRSRFWMNLHHTLTEAVQTDSRMQAWRQPQGWPTAQLQAWQEALRPYQQAFAEPDLLFDLRFNALRRALLDVPDTGPLPSMEEALRPFIEALNHAVEAYRQQMWPAHHQANLAWIANAQTLLHRWGADLQLLLERALRAPLPELITVDLVARTGDFAGAYTHPNPSHSVISSLNEGYQGDATLEMLFHESGHLGMDDALQDAINALLAPRGLTDRKDLWHALQFFTVGQLTQRVLAASGLTYQTYATRQKLFGGRWSFAQGPLMAHWQPYLDGLVSHDNALQALVDACYPS